MIVERQTQFGWGKSIIENLSKDLQKEFPNENGFGMTNLSMMRRFYADYQDNTILQPLAEEIGWTHNVIIMQKCKTTEERRFYMIHRYSQKNLKGYCLLPKKYHKDLTI